MVNIKGVERWSKDLRVESSWLAQGHLTCWRTLGFFSLHHPPAAYNLCLHCLVCIHGTLPNKLWASQYQIVCCFILAKSCIEPKLHSLFIYLFTQCQKQFQRIHKEELILSSNNLIGQCFFLVPSLDETADLGSLTQLFKVMHFVGGRQAIKI